MKPVEGLSTAKPAGALLLKSPAELLIDRLVTTVEELFSLQSGSYSAAQGNSLERRQVVEAKAFALCRTVKELSGQSGEAKATLLSLLQHRIYTLYSRGAASKHATSALRHIQAMLQSELSISKLFGLMDLCVPQDAWQEAVDHSAKVFHLYQHDEKQRMKQAVATTRALQSFGQKRDAPPRERLVEAMYAAKRKQTLFQSFSEWKSHLFRRQRFRTLIQHAAAIQALKSVARGFCRWRLATTCVQPEEIELHVDLDQPRPSQATSKAPKPWVKEQRNKVINRGTRPHVRRQEESKVQRCGRKLPWET